MRTVFKAKMDGSEAVRFHHVPLTGIYLGLAQHHANNAAYMTESKESFRSSLIAIVFSAFAIECFINERAEDVVEADALDDFYRGRKEFSELGSPISKIKWLLARKGFGELAPSLEKALAETFALRNELVHYKLSKAAGKSHLKPAEPTLAPDGSIVMWSVSFIHPPTNVEPPLISRISFATAAACFNSAYDFLTHWMGQDVEAQPMEGFSRIGPAKVSRWLRIIRLFVPSLRGRP